MRSRYGIASLALAFYAYMFIRELGHISTKLIFRLSIDLRFIYGIVPSVDVTGCASEPFVVALLIASGPVAALAVGYILVTILRWRMPPSLFGSALGMLSYFCLVLDPIYFAVIPVLHLGGEPDALILTGRISQRGLIAIALGVLTLNLVILRLKLIPILKEHPGS